MSDNIVTGEVKWFDPTKGFGFVVPDDGGKDILLHVNVLRNFGQSSVADGAAIVIEAQDTDRGQQAVRIIDITTLAAHESKNYTPEQIAAMEVEPARCKWFDPTKGFGFANVFGQPDVDVFVHADVLYKSGLTDLMSGEAIGLCVVAGERGPTAIDVVIWSEMVLPNKAAA